MVGDTYVSVNINLHEFAVHDISRDLVEVLSPLFADEFSFGLYFNFLNGFFTNFNLN